MELLQREIVAAVDVEPEHFDRCIGATTEEDPASGDQRQEQIDRESTVVTPLNAGVAYSRKRWISFEHRLLTTHRGVLL